MNYESVTSSNIAAIAYDLEKKVLGVQFHSTGIYHYEGVEPEVHEALMNADSIGKYFNTNVKMKYPYSKMA